MSNRLETLAEVGIAVGERRGVLVNSADLLVASTPVVIDPSLSGYSEYTPVQVRSYTKRKKNADMERNRQRD